MNIKRTANAGVLLNMDNVSILLDGVCKELEPYSGTPERLWAELSADFPDIVAFTHMHEDHYDASYAEEYKRITFRSVYGPECSHSICINGINLHMIPTRHIGKTEVLHTSYVISGSMCVWFVGDASPLVWKNIRGLPMPDVVIVPYAYATSESAWRITKSLGAKAIVLVHLPKREKDTYGLWGLVEETTKAEECLYIPEIGETIEF